MSRSKIQTLAESLLAADTEAAVIDLLKELGYWDHDAMWRNYGDIESNFSTIGNQGSRPESALAEKIVNCVDARLLAECHKRGIDPESASAPQTIAEAVATFFAPGTKNTGIGGSLKDWPQARVLEQSRHITVAVTGAMARKGNACITIVDQGEGQSPGRVPETFLSINKNNKLRVPFVQGKFNMGGTGALRFCGKHNLQLLITKRDPDVASARQEATEDAADWSVTIVRRESPILGAGRVRSSVYRYLAPLNSAARPNGGDLLRFSASCIKALPAQNRAYDGELRAGSIVKMFEYDMKGFRSSAILPDGLLSKLDVLLPGIALPVRVHECRDGFRGDAKRSFETSMVGLLARLEENRGGNLEPNYPASLSLKVRNEEMVAQIFAFKQDRAQSYTVNEGIIFTINGQTHGSIPRTFFERRSVRMQRLAKSLLVIVDCSALSVRAREDLFMNSRDRLTNGELRKAIEEELEDAISKHPGLRALQETRKSAEIEARLSESKPLEDVLGTILKSSPSLSALFLTGQRLSKPHKQVGDGEGDGGGGGGKGTSLFRSRLHPTFFHFRGKHSGDEISRTAELGRKCRVKFETDVENEYFSRPQLRGTYNVEVMDGPLEGQDLDHNMTLFDGTANWSVTLPDDQLSVGDKVTLAFSVVDKTLQVPFVNTARIVITAQAEDSGGGAGKRTQRKGSGSDDGDAGSGKDDESGAKEPGGLSMPNIIKVHKQDWASKDFDERDACAVVEEDAGDRKDSRDYTFYVNVDNLYLSTDTKGKPDAARVIEAKFTYACVLVGLALVHDERSKKNGKSLKGDQSGNDGEVPISETVRAVTRALAPFLVPMIDNLGALSDESFTGLAAQGDES